MSDRNSSLDLQGPLEELRRVASALSDSNRLRIIVALTDGPQNVTELTEALDLRQPLVSHHLAVLVDAGLTEVRREGRCRVYELRTESPSILPGLGDAIRSLGEASLGEATRSDAQETSSPEEEPSGRRSPEPRAFPETKAITEPDRVTAGVSVRTPPAMLAERRPEWVATESVPSSPVPMKTTATDTKSADARSSEVASTESASTEAPAVETAAEEPDIEDFLL